MPFILPLFRTAAISVAFMQRKASVRWPLYASNMFVFPGGNVLLWSLCRDRATRPGMGSAFWGHCSLHGDLCSDQDNNELTTGTHKSHSSKLSLAEFLHVLFVSYTLTLRFDFYLFNLLYLWDLTSPLISNKNEEYFLLVL